MTHPFEVREEFTVDATPDEVWEAIASGPGVELFSGDALIEPQTWPVRGRRAALSTQACFPL